MTSSDLKLSKAEWRQVADIAARIDWGRHSPEAHTHLEAGLNDRAAAALHQLLRLM